MKVAMYQSTKYDWMRVVSEVAKLGTLTNEWVLISRIIDVELEMLTDSTRDDAIKDLQSKIEAAQVELNQLLGEK